MKISAFPKLSWACFLVLLGGCAASAPTQDGVRTAGSEAPPARVQSIPQTASTQERSYWFTGTVFDHNLALRVAQCRADPENCEVPPLEQPNMETACAALHNRHKCMARKWHNRVWHPERAVFGADGRHLLVTVCRDEDRERCTLKRYWIEERRWDDPPGLDATRHYGFGTYDPDGKRIAAATWRCKEKPRPPDPPILKRDDPGPTGTICESTDQRFWLLDAEGRLQRELLQGETTRETDLGPDATRIVRQHPGVIVKHPTFSPDGRRIAYWRVGALFSRNGKVIGGGWRWHVEEMDLATDRARLVEDSPWTVRQGSPLYLEGGRKLAFSFDDYIHYNGGVFVVDLAAELPPKEYERLLDPEPRKSPLFVRDVQAGGTLALVSAFGGDGARYGSLYLYDLRQGKHFFDIRPQGMPRKLWQEEGAGMALIDAAFSRDGHWIVLIKGREQREIFDDASLQLWLIETDGSPRHVRLPQ